MKLGCTHFAAAMDPNFELVNPQDPVQEQKFEDIQDVDFDSGTSRDITRKRYSATISRSLP